MRRNKSLLLVASATLALSLSGLASAGIDATKHNMSSSGGGTIKANAQGSGGTDEICVFCHTPHMNVAKGDVLPLWNHRLSTGLGGGYTMYKSASFNGADNLTGDISLAAPSHSGDLVTGGMSVTNLCLSCHDGTQAVNAMFNPPNRVGASDPTMVGVDTIPNTSNAWLGTDLSNDHPVNFSYTVSQSVSDETLVAPDPSGNVSGTDGTVRLFNDTVQCASCHDPHKDYNANPEYTPFLRVPISGSKLCLTCHAK